MTFGRSRRLESRSDFDRVFCEGRSAGDGLLVVYARPNGLDRSRLGIVAGRRIGGAVARNRAKRLVREAFRTSPQNLPDGWDFVVIPQKIACNATAADVKSSLEKLAGKVLQSWRK